MNEENTVNPIRHAALRCLPVAIVFAACTVDPRAPAFESLTSERLSGIIETLASDEFEGRGPSSAVGEERTVSFLETEFRDIGIEPGNGSSYIQDVPLVALRVNGDPTMAIRGNDTTTRLAYGEDMVVWTKRIVEATALRASELVFVGYGIVAPEYDWNDYEDLNVRGKTVVILVNDPGFVTQDEALFNGNTMTYYGRWTYKYEEAARQGASGALIVHETAPAGYGWNTVRNSWTGPQFDLVADDNNMSRVAVEGWVARDKMREIFAQAGQDYDRLEDQAQTRGFQAVPLGVRASVLFQNDIDRSGSKNVVGVLPGTDRADEYVIYMAHWDHFGIDTSLEGDQIYNGAFDNASGTAGLMTLARAFANLPERPSRSIMFLAVTAEEFGLLGSAYYAANPVVPTNKTVTAINIDGLNVLGPMNDVTVVGYGNSELDDYLEEAATEAGRVVRSDPEPEKGFYYRSDHFSLAKVGIPALYADAGIDHVEHGEQWTMDQRDEYNRIRYHQPGDEFDPNWDLRGAIDDLKLLFTVGYRIAASSDYPNWRDGTEFKALRDADMMETSGVPIGMN